ncbi:Flowering-promoting factor [Vigna angularis]|uniref:Flowering-promoting factor n=1 Tax=Phaseolus angularis TaxID=3914 RepID=A0A8T0KKF3_PHAAN|nr:Flowering-promoting factor [Vigna angularis]
MSGVWVFNKGVVRLVENPSSERKVLVHSASNEIITSYAVLEHKLSSLGWERYYDDPDLLQFHKRSTVHLISLPRDFNRFRSMHMYDIVVKNKNYFESEQALFELARCFAWSREKEKLAFRLSIVGVVLFELAECSSSGEARVSFVDSWSGSLRVGRVFFFRFVRRRKVYLSALFTICCNL